MTETLFSHPHGATASEARLVRARYADLDLDAMRAEEERLSADQRLTTIYELYAIRDDAAMMEATLGRIADRTWAAELGYRDVYPSVHFGGE